MMNWSWVQVCLTKTIVAPLGLQDACLGTVKFRKIKFRLAQD